MKKIFLATAMAALLLFQAPQAKAWGFGWGVGAGLLGGVAVGTAIAASHPYYAPPAYYAYPGPYYGGYVAPRYYAPAAYYAPAPVVVVGAPVIGFGYGYGRGYYGHGYYRGGYYGRR